MPAGGGSICLQVSRDHCQVGWLMSILMFSDAPF